MLYSITFRLSEYIGESRNIMLGKKENRKARRVHVGREEIVRFLQKLPATKHLDYVIDMPVALVSFVSSIVYFLILESFIIK